MPTPATPKPALGYYRRGKDGPVLALLSHEAPDGYCKVRYAGGGTGEVLFSTLIPA